jgi:TRAP-type C4-dicarboxylate transport system substrate-binding protein
MRKAHGIAAGLIVVSLMVASELLRAQAPPRELKLSTAAGPTVPLGRAANRWSELVARAGRSTTLKVYAGASLAQHDSLREWQALVAGGTDAAVGSALAWSIQVPVLAVYALPWSAPDPVALNAIVADADVRRTIAARLESSGVVLLAMAALGYRDVATVSHPIRSCTDLAGLRLRVVAHPMLLELYAALGAHPSAMTFAAAQGAFVEGKLDGEEGPPASLAAARIVGARDIVVTGGIGDAMLFAIRRDVWTSLDATDQQLLRSTAEQAAREVGGAEADEAALIDLRRQGNTVTRFGSTAIAQCRAAAQSVSDKWAQPVGQELVEQARAIATRARAQTR